MCSQIGVHRNGFGSGDGDIVGEGPLLQVFKVVLRLAEIRVGVFNVDCNDGVVDVPPAVAWVEQG